MDMKKKNEAPAPETKESRAAIRREKAVSSLFAILLILTLVLAMGYSTYKQFEAERDAAYDPRSWHYLLLANFSFMRLNLFRPILALSAHIIERTNIAIGRAQKMILTASCAV